MDVSPGQKSPEHKHCLSWLGSTSSPNVVENIGMCIIIQDIINRYQALMRSLEAYEIQATLVFAHDVAKMEALTDGVDLELSSLKN